MKWFLFFVTVLSLFSCKNENKSVSSADLKPKPQSYNDTVRMPWQASPYIDSGYFKGTIPESLDSLESYEETPLYSFLQSIISKKEIILLNKETLGHSVFVNPRKKVRFDTLRNSSTTIISAYSFDYGKKEFQKISIDGHVVMDYKWSQDDDDSLREEVFALDEETFRHFSFKGKQYYYIQAHSFYSSGGSVGNIYYHIIYDLANKKISLFQTCRFWSMLFGDVNGDDNLDYIDFDNTDFCTTVPLSDSVTIQLYSCNKKGIFELQKDASGKPYFIDGNTGDGFSQDSFNVKSSHWPTILQGKFSRVKGE